MLKTLFILFFPITIITANASPERKPGEWGEICGQIPVTEGEIYFERSGKGFPIILLHSGLTDLREWKYQVAALENHFQVIAYDHRTSGKSSLPKKPFSHLEDLNHLFAYFNFESAHLLGHSVGGSTAIDFALEHPLKVDKLIVISSTLSGFPMSENYQKWNHGLGPVWGQPEKVAQQVLEFKDYPAYAVAMSHPTIKDFLWQLITENAEKAASWSFFEAPSLPPMTLATERLHELKPPLMAIVGEKDGEDMIAIGHHIKSVLPNSQLVLFRNGDHAVNLEYPKTLNSKVLNFLLE